MLSKEERENLIAQLSLHNYNGASALSDEKLLETFREISRAWVESVVAYNTNTKIVKNFAFDEIEERVKAELTDSKNLYDSLLNLLRQYSFEGVKDAIINNSSNINNNALEKMLFMLEIKYREYQEIVLEDIERKIDFMPREEAAGFMSFIETKRDDVELLKGILAQLQDAEISASISKITNIKKYILSNFLPQDLESNYKSFFVQSQDRQELIARLREISNAYSQKQLNDMTKEDLVDILTSFRQKELDEKKDAEDYEKYLDLFKKALYEDDNDVFSALVVRVVEDVSIECLQKLKETLRAEDELFDNKFQAAQKEWNKFK